MATVGCVMDLWLMLLPQGRCYCHGSIFYLNFSSEMFSRTSSHMCGRWYLPTFLFRDGLLTLMYRASFIALLRLCSSLPTMLKLSTLISWPVMVWWSNMGEGPFDKGTFWGYVPPFPPCWSYQHLYHDQWWYGGQIWGRGPFPHKGPPLEVMFHPFSLMLKCIIHFISWPVMVWWST